MKSEVYSEEKYFFASEETLNSLFEQAKEMHKQEMATNCSQQEISDEEIKKAAIGMGIATSIATAYFIEGAQWYRRKLKSK